MDTVNISLNENRDSEISEGNDKYDEKKDLDHNVDDISNSMQRLQIENETLNLMSNNQLSTNNHNCSSSSFNDRNRVQECCASRFQPNEASSSVMNNRKPGTSLIEILEKLKTIRELSIPTYNYKRVDEKYSRKVFVGGLPKDIYELQIKQSFDCFGPLIVDWPHKFESDPYFPPKGFAFLHFESDISVKKLLNCCSVKYNKLYWLISSNRIKDKPVEIRPWRVADADFMLDQSVPLDPRKTVFVGGVPRPMKAIDLATKMDNFYEGVCYASIDTDTELKYPKGSGRVTFNNQNSFIAAISDRFVQLRQDDIYKQVEVKPFVFFDQMCDSCTGRKGNAKIASFFCPNIMCLKYFCESCWNIIHSESGREYHKPFLKEFISRSNTNFHHL